MGLGGAGAAPLPGTPSLTLGAYDELLGRLAERRGDLAAAREWWRGAREQGVLVGSPHQVALAESHLARHRESRLPAARGGALEGQGQAVVAIPPSTGMTAPVT